MSPLFTLERACFAYGHVTTPPLSATGGERLVALVGYFSPFFRLLRAEARLAGGAVRLAGEDARSAVRRGTTALASREAPSVAWTTERYLRESALLSLMEERQAETRVSKVLASFGLAEVATRRLSELDAAERRLISLARAHLGEAAVVCAEAPLAELDAASEARVAEALAEIAETRRLIVSFPAQPLGGRARELFERADFTVVIRGDAVVAS